MKKSGKGIYAIKNNKGHAQGPLHYESFQNGLETLVETLEQQLTPNSILKGVKVENIEKLPDNTLQINVNNIAPIHADAVIMTTPFNTAKMIFKDYGVMQNLPNMNYATIATVTMAFKQGQISKYKDALNFFVSRNSDLAITSCTWNNRKWDNVAPEGYDLLRVYIGRVGDESIVELSDSEIEKIVIQDLQKAIDLQSKPLFTVVARWKQSMPQYTVGHEKRLAELKQQFEEQFPQVQLIGSSYEGISVPDCVAQGKEAAKQVVEQLFAV